LSTCSGPPTLRTRIGAPAMSSSMSHAWGSVRHFARRLRRQPLPFEGEFNEDEFLEWLYDFEVSVTSGDSRIHSCTCLSNSMSCACHQGHVDKVQVLAGRQAAGCHAPRGQLPQRGPTCLTVCGYLLRSLRSLISPCAGPLA
jgi:hypothetical protein